MTPAASLYDLDRDQLATLLDGEPRYRLDQIWTGLYQQGRTPDELTTLPKPLRARLAAAAPLVLEPVTEQLADGGDTCKVLWRLQDGARVESVLMHYSDRSTVCVSTQAGCAMGCGFCATGQAGFERHLTAGEIVGQVLWAIRRTASTPAPTPMPKPAPAEGGDPRRLGNVVFMGMGEPLANYERLWAAIERLHGDVGISARRLTVSTVGIVPGIRRLAAERLPVNLAVSLHAARDELRDELVPINRRYRLAELTEACRDYLAVKNRRLSFEWAMIDGVNDSARDAAELAALVRPLRAHVNLIPLNRTPGWPTTGSPPERIRRFRDTLVGAGVNATVRANRGTDIAAACGQLAAGQPVRLEPGHRR
jgi:23S rRNA (adenine2503-C2)-methyltransferase